MPVYFQSIRLLTSIPNWVVSFTYIIQCTVVTHIRSDVPGPVHIISPTVILLWIIPLSHIFESHYLSVNNLLGDFPGVFVIPFYFQCHSLIIKGAERIVSYPFIYLVSGVTRIRVGVILLMVFTDDKFPTIHTKIVRALLAEHTHQSGAVRINVTVTIYLFEGEVTDLSIFI